MDVLGNEVKTNGVPIANNLDILTKIGEMTKCWVQNQTALNINVR
jgi:hypothetical protein